MKTKTTNNWRIWSIDTLGNDADGYEFNDRWEIGSFILDPSEIENETDEKAIEHVFSSLENQDHDFSFSDALKNETITAEFEENSIFIYEKTNGRLLFQIENDLEIVA